MLLLGVLAAFPFDRFVVDDAAKQLHAAGTPVWVQLQLWSVTHGQTGHRAIALVALATIAPVSFVPRRRAWALAVPVTALFVANAAMLWKAGIDDTDRNVFADQSSASRAWIDEAVPASQTVTMLYVPSTGCGERLGYAYVRSEFLNDRVAAAPRLGLPPEDGGLPAETAHVARGGRVIESSGRPLAVDWLVVPPGVEVRGTRVAEGTLLDLGLWRVDGPVVVRADSNRQLVAQGCSGGLQSSLSG